ncbi:uncharacterized protein LOC113334729 [Papaver somniferum]|uniref:uncharacterized protein LOC113334729 n=1 Tax=Papaver somniferum TaxID=3469 RepID=UPI000E6F5C80|nr:uncharacterized protein LOC113334729 [Papaver somniferum]XP_026436702.1 uncharacterized protein LOC113334729 [Papaver somniferum]XP_026436703.1 uncharacterized protein LOC113334729 [Papaver somniferum]XP_026436704.1 uncharacterized protein LOC113334729 [Papaver somniferum]XP_026436705.1 uncharacterized protein LOC113334729 [Papaver somniferum]XP_026436706.1 uncharacterized protein LOC113334729 [Papaver somniferum]XP_026436707.1 uncharacterized protein LOC113334729 [Papaver somniferum]XP_0
MSKKRKDANLNTPLWNYVEKQGKSDEGGGNNKIQCTICNYIFFGSYTRVKAHLLRIEGQGVKICEGIDPGSFEELKKLSEDADMRSQHTKTGSLIPLPGVENYGTVARKGDKAYGNLFNASARDKLDHTIGRFFFGCGIAFNNIRSPLFRDMIQCAANSNIVGYIPPSAQRLSTKLLEEEKRNVDKMLIPIKSGWKRNGVSIVSDGWSDNNSRPLINFMGVSSSGPVFLKAVDTSGNYKDAAYLASLFKNTIEEVGVKNVVQLITDNAPVCKAAAMQVENTFKHIFWTPCVAHTLNLALKDLC